MCICVWIYINIYKCIYIYIYIYIYKVVCRYHDFDNILMFSKIVYVRLCISILCKCLLNMQSLYMNQNAFVYIYIYIYIYVCVCVCVCVENIAAKNSWAA